MTSLITIEGVDQAISGLNYKNKDSLKYKLINAIRRSYEDDAPIKSVQAIEAGELIKVLWGMEDDPAIIKKRRKNLSAVKYSVNVNLKELYREGKNPEGIVIGSDNIFSMSDEAKDNALQSIKKSMQTDGAIALDKITDILNIINETLSDPENIPDAKSKEGLKKLVELKNVIRGLSNKFGVEVSGPTDSSVPGSVLEEKKVPDVPDISKGHEFLRGASGDQEAGGSFTEGQDKEEDVGLDGDQPEEVTEELEEAEPLEEDEVVEELEDIDIEDAEEEIEAAEPEEDIALEADQTEEIIVDDEDIDEEEPEEDIEAIDIDDTLEELEEAEPLEENEVVEELGVEEVDDEDIDEEEPEEDLEEVELLQGTPGDKEVAEGFSEGRAAEKEEAGAEGPAGINENANPDTGGPVGEYINGGHEESDKIKKARILAEEFNQYLGVIDRFYNQYILVPEGHYVVGARQPKVNERPEQKVCLPKFYMGKFPVTNALFEIFVEKTGYRTIAERLGYGKVYKGRLHKTVDEKTGLVRYTWNSSVIAETVEGACWHQPLGPGSTLHNKRNHPVVQVTLEDAVAFAAWTGKRLPTEAEWEAASRLFDGVELPWGNSWKEDFCNTEENSIGDTTPVDKYIKSANDLEIADTIGNVLEWTSDKAESPSYINNSSRYRIAKGGSWISGNDIRLFSRFKLESESCSNILGFRCVAY